jgi:hypothetical protein
VSIIDSAVTPENVAYSVVKYAIEEKSYRKFAILYPFSDIGMEYYKYFKYFHDTNYYVDLF